MFKRWGKKFLTVIFISAIVLSVLPFGSVGSMTASASSYNCTSEKLQSLINQYNGDYWNSSYCGSYKCKGFADLMFNKLYGTGSIGPYNSGYHYYLPKHNGAEEVAKTSKASYSDVYDMMHKAQSGDYVQWSRGYSQHSAIFVSCDEKGFYIFDCNYISPNICGVHYVTFEKIARTNYGISIYTSVTNAKPEPEPEEPAVVEVIPEAFEFSESAIELSFQETAKPKIKGDKEIAEWTTSNNAVVVVDSKGKITGIGAGTATVTVTATDGEQTSCQVTVKCSQYRVAIEGFLQGFQINAKAMDALTKGVPVFLYS
jgi:hypothetical protein